MLMLMLCKSSYARLTPEVLQSTQTRKEHNLNQQQDFDLGHKLNKADSETESCKGYSADGYRTGNKYGIGLWDKSKNTQTRE